LVWYSKTLKGFLRRQYKDSPAGRHYGWNYIMYVAFKEQSPDILITKPSSATADPNFPFLILTLRPNSVTHANCRIYGTSWSFNQYISTINPYEIFCQPCQKRQLGLVFPNLQGFVNLEGWESRLFLCIRGSSLFIRRSSLILDMFAHTFSLTLDLCELDTTFPVALLTGTSKNSITTKI